MTTLTRADWEQRARDLKIEGRAYINGEYTDAVSAETFECISPVDGRLLGKIASCDAADAQRAVENARATFNSGVWSRLAPAKRKATMIRFAGLLKSWPCLKPWTWASRSATPCTSTFPARRKP
jgi:4-guanidinobutyraldehyde dehydrogenase/NAD-dependent aldehyde dehydrogenase